MDLIDFFLKSCNTQSISNCEYPKKYFQDHQSSSDVQRIDVINSSVTDVSTVMTVVKSGVIDVISGVKTKQRTRSQCEHFTETVYCLIIFLCVILVSLQ